MTRILTKRAFLTTAGAAAVTGTAAWAFQKSRKLSGHAATGGGMEFRTIDSGGKKFTVCDVSPSKARLELFLSDEMGKPFNRFDRLHAWLRRQNRKLLFAMNAGMFHPGFIPVGLFVSEGKTLAPLNTADGQGNFFLKPNGVLAITDKGASMIETSEFPKTSGTVRLATQSGPMLVRRGQLHPAFNVSSVSRLIRNGAGVPSPDKVIFAISDEPVNFHEFALLFRDTLHCPDALFLDGTISSLHAPALKRHDSSHDLGPIIGVAGPL